MTKGCEPSLVLITRYNTTGKWFMTYMDTPKLGFWARENENSHQTNVFTETADPNLILEYPF